MQSVELHGCTGPDCDQVWRECEEGQFCPKCNTARYDEHGKAKEFVIWFPLTARFESLLKCPQYQHEVRHECRRPNTNTDYITDVYDCEWWKELMGHVVGFKITRMGLLLCLDGFPAFHGKHKGAPSLVPVEFINLSLAPHLRYDPDNILMWMLIPDDMSASRQLKYFKFVCLQELNPLQTRGVPGPDGPVKIKLFGGSLDLKGKEKFYNQSTVTSYCGCSTCCVHYDQTPAGKSYDCSRRFLPADHPLRSKDCDFEGLRLTFHNEETRPPPKVKTTQTIFTFLAGLRRLGVEHYMGQKGPPMLMYLQCYMHDRFNILEWMHNCKCAFDNTLDLLVGRDDGGKWDMKARKTSKALGLFPTIWPENVVMLPQRRHQILSRLTDDTINAAGSVWIRRWLRLCDIIPDKRTRVHELRGRLTEVRDKAARGEPVPTGKLHPLPWRLTPEAHDVVNRRAATLCYPHYSPVCHIGEDSFINRTGCWRTASKLICFLVILIPILRGFVTTFRAGLRRVVHGLRILEGQTCSVNEAAALNLERGCNIFLRKSNIDLAKLLILTGLAIIEGCIPVLLLMPALHCLCHYGYGAALWGLLKLLWMISFERYNKKCKNLTSNKKFPLRSLANALVRDAVARYYRWRRGESPTRVPKLVKTQVTGQGKPAVLPRAISIQIRLTCGCRVATSSVYSHDLALIGNKKFHADEPLIASTRCGSVIVRVMGDGGSVYGLAKTFLRVICKCVRVHDFVVVTWLPRPVYPDGDPLTVQIKLGGIDVNNMNNKTVSSLNDIQPSRVIVGIDTTYDCLYPMRIDGTDVLI